MKFWWYYLKALLHDQSFCLKLGQSFLTENVLKENFVKVIPFTWSKFGQSFYPKLSFGGKFKENKMSELDLDFEKMFWLVNSHQSFSKNEIGFYSVKVHQSSLKKFLMQLYTIKEKFLMANFDD